MRSPTVSDAPKRGQDSLPPARPSPPQNPLDIARPFHTMSKHNNRGFWCRDRTTFVLFSSLRALSAPPSHNPHRQPCNSPAPCPKYPLPHPPRPKIQNELRSAQRLQCPIRPAQPPPRPSHPKLQNELCSIQIPQRHPPPAAPPPHSPRPKIQNELRSAQRPQCPIRPAQPPPRPSHPKIQNELAVRSPQPAPDVAQSSRM